jgi:hypothetical protein
MSIRVLQSRQAAISAIWSKPVNTLSPERMTVPLTPFASGMDTAASTISNQVKISPYLDAQDNNTQKKLVSYSLQTKVFPAAAEPGESSEIIDQIIGLYQKLSALPNLEPCAEVNELYTSLVTLCITHRSESVTSVILSHKEIQRIAPSLHHLCSSGEGLLETHWAKRILQTSTTASNKDKRTFSRLLP